jgi:hypothetical protein
MAGSYNITVIMLIKTTTFKTNRSKSQNQLLAIHRKKHPTQAGYRVENRSIEVSIKNQPFTAYEENGEVISICYDVQVKGHFQNWEGDSNYKSMFASSNSEFTTITYSLDQSNTADSVNPMLGKIPASGQVDFQVEAFTGSLSTDYSYLASDDKSGWSNIQTIIIPDTSPSTTPSPTTSLTPTSSQSIIQGVSQGEFYITISILAIIIAALSIILIVFMTKIKKTKQEMNQEKS